MESCLAAWLTLYSNLMLIEFCKEYILGLFMSTLLSYSLDIFLGLIPYFKHIANL